MALSRNRTISRLASAEGDWEMIRGSAHPGLRDYVRGYTGYRERPAATLIRRELPGPSVTVIIGFGAAIGVGDPRVAGGAPTLHRAFVAGLSDAYAVTETRGESRGVQIDFTPVGAYRFLALPMDSIANRVIELDEVFGSAATDLIERLAEAVDWERRFAILDEWIGARITSSGGGSPGVALAMDAISASGGRAAIGAIARELRWSNRRLIEGFREEVGLAPKLVARLVRFDRVVREIKRGRFGGWSALAHDCGYYDQPHFVREFAEFSGSTPSDFLKRWRPESNGVIGD